MQHQRQSHYATYLQADTPRKKEKHLKKQLKNAVSEGQVCGIYKMKDLTFLFLISTVHIRCLNHPSLTSFFELGIREPSLSTSLQLPIELRCIFKSVSAAVRINRLFRGGGGQRSSLEYAREFFRIVYLSHRFENLSRQSFFQSMPTFSRCTSV